jgi:hypothetical protein
MTTKRPDKDMELLKASILRNLKSLPFKDIEGRFKVLSSFLDPKEREHIFYILDKKTGKVKEWKFKK